MFDTLCKISLEWLAKQIQLPRYWNKTTWQGPSYVDAREHLVRNFHGLRMHGPHFAAGRYNLVKVSDFYFARQIATTGAQGHAAKAQSSMSSSSYYRPQQPGGVRGLLQWLSFLRCLREGAGTGYGVCVEVAWCWIAENRCFRSRRNVEPRCDAD
jgi:hypothetical protein